MRKRKTIRKLEKELSNWYDYKVLTIRRNKFGKTTDIIISANRRL